MLGRAYNWVIRHLFFLSRSTRGSIINLSSLVMSVILSINFFGRRNWLTHRHQLPAPRYFTKFSNGRTPASNLIKQIRAAGVKQSEEYFDKVSKSSDPSYTLLSALNMTEEMMADEVANVNTIVKYNHALDPQKYEIVTEKMFGELIVNGENPYALKRMQLESESAYQKELFKSLQQEKMDQDVLEEVNLGFKLCSLEDQLKHNNPNIYVLDLKELRDVHPSEPYFNKMRIEEFTGVKMVETVIQFPYAVFVRLNNKKTGEVEFVCVAAVLRYTQEKNKYVTISPFFTKIRKQSPQIWQVVRAHIAHAHSNDFTFRTHLGVLHLITEQYNVPLYNYLRYTPKYHDRVQKFFKYAFEPFNKGLEGVNRTAFSTLISQEFPTVSNVFSVTPKHAFEAINTVSLNLDMNNYNTITLAKNNGLQDLLRPNSESAVYFDSRIQSVLDKYIDGVYDACGMAECEEGIKYEVNQTIRKATNRHHPINDVRGLFKSLAFCWVTYHAHTFSDLSLSTYVRFRPTAMSKGIPHNEKEWPSIRDIEYIPTPKMLMSAEQLTKQVTFRDGSNYLTDVLSRLSFDAQSSNDPKIEALATEAVLEYDKIAHELEEVNNKRRARNMFEMVWLRPSKMQASLNI